MNSPLELYTYLQKSNCRQCMLPSCMAFAVAVIQGKKTADNCPHIDAQTMTILKERLVKRRSLEDDQEEMLARLKKEIAALDFRAAASRLGVTLQDGRIPINCLGKDFLVDSTGEIYSECHKNVWVELPILHYIKLSKGVEPKNEWVAFGDLDGTADWGQFFSHRCEEALRQLTDEHQDLIFELLNLFGAKTVSGIEGSDRSVVLYPLPKIPIIINYWVPEDDFASKVNILFDRTAAENLDTHSLYLLSRGLIEMFRELIVKHSADGKLFS